MLKTAKRKTRQERSPQWTTISLEPRILLAGDIAAAPVSAPTAEIATVQSNVDSSQIASRIPARSMVFIDATLQQADDLIAGVPSDSEIVLLDSTQDMIAQMTATLKMRSGVQELHLVTHGQAGELILGDQTVDTEALRQSRGQLQSWSTALAPGADVLVYGCNTGQGAAGNLFVSQLAKLTGTDVAASNNLTGSETLSGDWVLEVQTGNIESLVAFDASARNRFQHTLDVVINARGQTGEEEFELLIGGTVVQSWTATTELQSYSYQSKDLQASDVEVRFTNDLYQPEIGVDRNLTVQNVVIDGFEYSTLDPDTYSDAVWVVNEVRSGFGIADTLVTNGSFFFDFRDRIFAGGTWNSDNPNAELDIDQGQLSLSSPEAASAWRSVSMIEGDPFRLTVEATRFFFPGDGQPQAAVGIDFRNAAGEEIDQVLVGVNEEFSSPLPQTTLDFVAPQGTVSATVWVWVDAPDSGVSEILLNRLDISRTPFSSDTEAPTAELLPDQIVTGRGQSADFVVDYFDNEQLSQSGQLLVTGPNGYQQTAATFTGSGNGETEQRLLHGVFRENGGPFEPGRDWSDQDNGEYTVTLVGGTLIDAAGNAAPEQVLGTFTIDISGDIDAIPPTAELLTTTSIVNDDGEAQFLLQYEDNEDTVRFVNEGANAVTVTGPNGYEESFGGFAGGPGNGPNQTIEAFVLPPGPNGYVPGEYFVTVNDNYVRDIAGNLLPSQLLGSFVLEVAVG